MPKTPQTEAHFDAAALLLAVSQQDVGLRIATNNPEGFKRILYTAMRRGLGPRCHVYRLPSAPDAFFLLREPAPAEEALALLEPPPGDEDLDPSALEPLP